jgi:hypothetical protein
MNFAGNLLDNILVKLITDNPDRAWDWKGISQNPNITMKDITDNPLPWDWKGISQNPNITMKDITDNPLPWEWYQISWNPNITMKYITDNPDKPWHWDCMSINEFNKDKIVIIQIDITIPL